jgi:low temperature requirement protein LtrA
VLADAPNARGATRMVVMLAVIWWMYGGYAWLTNAVRPDAGSRRLVFFAAMAAYFVLALAIPTAFAGAGLAFGLAYLAIVVLHALLFTRASEAGTVRAILTLSPYNLAAAVMVVVGGAVGGTTQYLLWAAAGLFEWAVTPLLRGAEGFLVAPAHFVERHGLVVLIAIGESVIALGVGASHLPIDGSLVAAAVVGLAFSACLWWLYFGGDDTRAEHALLRLPDRERATAALRAFGYWHLPMLLGIVAVASVEREATEHPFHTLDTARAVILAGGVAAYLAGDALFRFDLHIGRVRFRAIAAVAAFATVPVGTNVSPFWQGVALVAILLAAIAAESAQTRATR